MDISTPGKPEGLVVVLMNGGTISAAEDFTDVIRRARTPSSSVTTLRAAAAPSASGRDAVLEK